MINYYFEDTPFKLKNKRSLSNWLRKIAISHSFTIADLNIVFCSDSYLLNINKQYLNHDYFTDVITFDTSGYSLQKQVTAPLSKSSHSIISGDVFISVDTVKNNSLQYSTPFDQELCRVMAHALLHLCGFNDLTDLERSEMTANENLALDLFNEA